MCVRASSQWSGQLGEVQNGRLTYSCPLPSPLTDSWAFPLKRQQTDTGIEHVAVLSVMNHSL